MFLLFLLFFIRIGSKKASKTSQNILDLQQQHTESVPITVVLLNQSFGEVFEGMEASFTRRRSPGTLKVALFKTESRLMIKGGVVHESIPKFCED